MGGSYAGKRAGVVFGTARGAMGGLFCGTSAAAQASSVIARIVAALTALLPARQLLVHYIAVKLADSSSGCSKALQRVSPFSGVPGEALPPGQLLLHYRH